MLQRSGTANNKGYLLGAMLGGTNSNNTCAVSHETKFKHTMPLVLLDQSTIKIIEIMQRSGKKGKHLKDISKSFFTKHSRKENLTKDHTFPPWWKLLSMPWRLISILSPEVSSKPQTAADTGSLTRTATLDITIERDEQHCQ